MRHKGDAIEPFEPQWINGDNEPLEMYRQSTQTTHNKMLCLTEILFLT